MDIIDLLDLVGTLGFVAALVTVALTPAHASGRFNMTTKIALMVGFGIFVYNLGVGVVNTPENGLLEQFEDFVEVLYPIVMLIAVISVRSAQQMGDLELSQRAAARSNEFMIQVFDSAPAGIMFIAPGGAIVFANDTARDILDISEDPETGALSSAEWVAKCSCGSECETLACLLDTDTPGPYEVRFEWPTGWMVDLTIHMEPMADQSGTIGGAVATFERPAARANGRSGPVR